MVTTDNQNLNLGSAAESGQYMSFVTDSGVTMEDLSGDELLKDVPRASLDGVQAPKLGKIFLIAQLGKGAMGAVYFGIHSRLKIGVAIKLLHQRLAKKDPVAVKRFFREAQTAARVNSPHLVNVSDVDEEHGFFFITMEYVKGQSAAQFIEDCRQDDHVGVSQSDALEVVIAASEGLAAAHEKGIIHRDVKPVNILLPSKAHGAGYDLHLAKLADLGLARMVDQNSGNELTANFTAMGTPGYMAPEQILNAKTVGKTADVFAMGGTLYALLCGVPPFHAKTLLESMHSTVERPHGAVGSHRSDVSIGLSAIVDRCLQKTPAERYSNATELLLDLKKCKRNLEAEKNKSNPKISEKKGADTTILRPTPTKRMPSPSARKVLNPVQGGDEAPTVLRASQSEPRDAPTLPSDGEQRLKAGRAETIDIPAPLEVAPSVEPDRKVADVQQMASKSSKLRAVDHKVYSRWPFGADEAKRRQKETAEKIDMPWAISVLLPGGISLDFNLVPAGRFAMGSAHTESGRSADEYAHFHTHTRPFYLGVFPVTQEQWQAVVGTNPSHFKNKPDSHKRPVERVSWTQVTNEFVAGIMSLAPRGWHFRLPSEAEWEYACRAGTESPFFFEYDLKKAGSPGMGGGGDRTFFVQSGLNQQAIFPANGDNRQETSAVGAYPANAWGLHDMAGNVWEWCQDWYDAEAYRNESGVDVIVEDAGEYRVLRGGSWNYSASYCRSARRYRSASDSRMFNFGFRIALVLP